MRITIFGLAVSSAWGNGHATLWRGLIRELESLGHRVTFFEKDVPYYASHRDLTQLPAGQLVLYRDWESVYEQARESVRHSDVAMVTSYCPDAQSASDLVLASSAGKCFYDLDTPITLARLDQGERVDYLPAQGLGAFDLVLSYTGGLSLQQLTLLGARRALPLYGSVDPGSHFPVGAIKDYACSLSYLGTYAPDRHDALKALFLEAAPRLPDKQFLVGGPLYPDTASWAPNVRWLPHVPPPQHPAFYGSSEWTLNLTRQAMAQCGYCPSGRLFEAAACGVPILTDDWPGLSEFFEPGREILVVKSLDQVAAALRQAEEQRRDMAARARQRVMREHTAARRAEQLVAMLSGQLQVAR